MIYLDNAATTYKKPDAVKRAMMNAYEECTSVGRGGYESASRAAEKVYTARERAAELFGAASPEQVVFTSNATHALNIAIKGYADKGNCVISSYEHNSVLRPIKADNDLECRIARGSLFDPEMMIESFRWLIDKDTRFVVCTHMSNVFGYILPVKEIDELCAERGIPLIIDASQSAGSIDVKLDDFSACKCICAPGHKGLYGPQGTGLLICRSGEEIKPFMEGGTGSDSVKWEQPDFMPDRLECGTHNVPGISGLSEGIAYILRRKTDEIIKRERALTDMISRELKKIDSLYVFSSKDESLQGGVVSFLSDRMSAEKIADQLAAEKIAVRSGLHCSPLAHRTVGTNMGTVRVSVSDFTQEKEVMYFAKKLRSILS